MLCCTLFFHLSLLVPPLLFHALTILLSFQQALFFVLGLWTKTSHHWLDWRQDEPEWFYLFSENSKGWKAFHTYRRASTLLNSVLIIRVAIVTRVEEGFVYVALTASSGFAILVFIVFLITAAFLLLCHFLICASQTERIMFFS